MSELSISTEEQNPAALEQSEECRACVRLVEKLLQQAKRYRSIHDSKWTEYYRYFRGKQWKERRPTYRHSEVINYIFSEIQNILVLMTDSRPQISVLPEEPSDLEFSEIISQILTSKWDSNEWSYTVSEAIIDASTYGTAIACIPWKETLLSGIGDFGFDTEDPFHCYPDPGAKSKINDEFCQYFITAVPTDIGVVKRDYPHCADLIKPDLTDLSQSNLDPNNYEEMRLKSPTDNRVIVESYTPSSLAKPNQVLLVTCYMKSYEKIEEIVGEEKDQQTGLTQKFYQDRYKYPNGRKIVIANQICLSDPEIDPETNLPKDSNEYINGSFPYAKLVDYILPREFWGVGDVEQMQSPQNIANKCISYALDVLLLMGNPIWVVDTESNVETQNLTNQPGLIVEKTKGSEVRREAGVPLNPAFLDIFNLMTERVMAKVGSTADVTNVPKMSNASGFAIEQLQEAAQTRIRGKVRNLEIFLKEVGELQVDRILQYYTVPRIVRLTNNQNATKYFKFHITDVSDEAGNLIKKKAIISDYSEDPETGQQIEGPPREVDLKSKLDIRINVGSSLAFAKAKKETTAKELFQMGILNPEELLDAIDYPNKEKIIERLKNQPPPPPEGQPGAKNA